MRWTGWLLARARARAPLVGAVAGLVAVSGGVIGGLLGLAQAQAAASIREEFAAGPAAGLTLQVRAGADPAEQDRLARESLTAGFAPARIAVRTTLISEPVRVGDLSLVAWAMEQPGSDGVSVVGGHWPEGDHEVALHGEAAGRSGLAVGDTLALADRVVTVSALWLPEDPADPRWQGDPLALRGHDAAVTGPLLASPDLVTGLPGTPLLRWTVVPELPTLTAAQLPALVQGAAEATALVRAGDATGRGVSMTGDLGPTAERATQALADAGAAALVPVTIVAAVSLTALVQVGRVVAAARAADARILLARGAAPAQVGAGAWAESVAAAALGAAAGGLAAALCLRVSTAGWGEAPEALAGAGLAFAGAAVGLGAVHVAHVNRLARNPGRGTRAVAAVGGVAAVVVVAAFAGLTTWRLLEEGRLVRPDGGVAGAALLAVLAPAALLAAAAVAALALLMPLTGVFRLLGRASSGGIVRWLAGSHLARAPLGVAVPAALTVMAVGAATVAGLFGGTSTPLAEDLATLRRGADLRVVLATAPAATTAVRRPPDLTDLAAVDAAGPVWLDDTAVLGNQPVAVLAAPQDVLERAVSLPRGSTLPLGALDPGPDDGPIGLPSSARELTVELAAGVAFDRWQEAQLALVPELSRRRTDAPYIADPAEAARELTTDTLAAAGQARRVRVAVTIRDSDTGTVETLQVGPLEVPGPAIRWDPVTDVVGWAPARAALRTAVALPGSGRFVVDGATVAVDDPSGMGNVELTLTLAVDGAPLGHGVGWRADAAVPEEAAEPYRELLAVTPVEVGIDEVAEGGLSDFVATSNRPSVPPMLAAVPGGWRLSGEATQLASVRLGPGIAFVGDDPARVVTAPPPGPRVPVALTAEMADAAGLEVGDEFELAAFQRRLPATLAALTPAVPGTVEPMAAVMDSSAAARVLSRQGQTMPWPTEAWGAATDARGAAQSAAGLPGVESVLAAVPVSASARSATVTMWAGAVGVLVLALAGIGATSVAQVAQRRGEVSILRRLGVPGSTQALSRAVEHALVGVLSTGLGLVAGGTVGALVVAPLARTAAGADARWPVTLRLDLPLWAGLLTCWSLGLALLIAGVAVAVGRQAASEREASR